MPSCTKPQTREYKYKACLALPMSAKQDMLQKTERKEIVELEACDAGSIAAIANPTGSRNSHAAEPSFFQFHAAALHLKLRLLRQSLLPGNYIFYPRTLESNSSNLIRKLRPGLRPKKHNDRKQGAAQ